MMIPYQGKQIEAEEIATLTENEKWSEYKLANGKFLAIKTPLIAVFRALSEKTPDGEDIYIAKTAPILMKVR